MFGPSLRQKPGVRGNGKNTPERDPFPWRPADKSLLDEIRNLSIRLGGQKTKASMNNLVSFLVEEALNDDKIIAKLEARFPSKRRFIQFYIEGTDQK